MNRHNDILPCYTKFPRAKKEALGNDVGLLSMHHSGDTAIAYTCDGITNAAKMSGTALLFSREKLSNSFRVEYCIGFCDNISYNFVQIRGNDAHARYKLFKIIRNTLGLFQQVN